MKKKKWYGTQNYKPEGQWNSTADVMVSSFEDSGHPVFRTSSALDLGFLKWKGGTSTIHFSGDHSNAGLFFFARSKLQISSVSTEQSRIGVMN